jgi:signal transduction histidine kinase
MDNGFLFGRRKQIIIISMILIIAAFYSLLFSQQYIGEQNIRNSIFQEYRNNQIEITEALSEHISSDLRLISSILQGLSDSSYLQQDELYGDKVENLVVERFNQINNISKIDGLFIADKNNIITYNKVSERQRSFVNIDISLREYVNETRSTLNPVFSNGFKGIDGTHKIALTFPIINRDSNEYLGMVGVEIPSVDFFARYGNVYNVDSQFLVTYDRNSNYISTPRTNFLGKSLFSDEVQSFFRFNDIQNNYYQNVFAGQLFGGYAIYDFGTGERLNTGYPISVDEKPRYFVFIITPTASVYNDINETLSEERSKFFLLIAGITAAILVLVLFLVKLNSILNEQVKRRTKDLEDSNIRLKTSNEQLNVQDKLQKEFINIAAHELRTPTQAIMGYTELDQELFDDILKHRKVIEDQELTSDVIHLHKDFKAISRNASRLNDLIKNLLDMARIESNRNNSLQIQKKRVDLVKEINEVNNLQLEQKIKAKNIKINFINLALEEHCWVYADKARLNQVLVNLIDNAIKFSPNNGIIDIRLKDNDYDHPNETTENYDKPNSDLNKSVLIGISDKGEGISPHIMPKLFEKFATDSEIGTGLGLYITRNIVEAHGGRIWAFNNKDGIGATFIFSLPKPDGSILNNN